MHDEPLAATLNATEINTFYSLLQYIFIFLLLFFFFGFMGTD